MSMHHAPDHFLHRDDASLRWRMQGSGPPVVLLHGWALDLDYWDPVARLLEQRFTLLRFDRRGFGGSTGLPDIHRNVDDLRALLDAAQVSRAVIVGMSQGARLAIHFALAHPSMTRALILDGAPEVDAEPELPLARLRQLLETAGPAELQREILRHPLMQLKTHDAGAQELLAAIVRRYTGKDLLHPVRPAHPPRLAQIEAPTLILNGSLDSPARLAAGRTLRSRIRLAAAEELADGGHLAALDAPESYARAVTAFGLALAP